MPHPAVILALGLLGCLAGCSEGTGKATVSPEKTAAAARLDAVGSGFDFYVLSLSWSPSYCAAEGDNANRQQCASGADLGFVLHGLWPQFEQGYPEFCASREPERVPDSLVRANLDLMPSAGLIGRQWRKHGSCTGLSQIDYFATARAARDRITIPANLANGGSDLEARAIEADFLQSNPGLDGSEIAVTCGDGLIREVRICLTRDGLDFRSCPEIDRRGCRGAADMPAPN